MYQKKIESVSWCPLDIVFEIFNGKWSSPVYCLIVQQGSVRYADFQNQLEGLSSPVLSSTLKNLMNHGVITRKAYDEIPIRVEYSLTEKGESLVPIFRELCHWSKIHHDHGALRSLPKCANCDYF